MSVACPSCAEPVAAGDDFCEACGTQLRDTARAAADVAQPAEVATPCAECGGSVDADGFCTACGARARTRRDHWSETPSADLGAICDRGIVHARNEDAMATAVAGLASVIVVCDGVTTAPDSDRASLAAAEAARDVLVAAVAGAPTGGAAAVEHWAGALTGSVVEANRAAVAIARSLGDPVEPPSCTFVAAVASGVLAAVAWCGDSRAYWLPDGGGSRQLTVDHSLGTEMIRSGVPRETAEADPTSHTITRWLGADSVSTEPEVVTVELAGPGWLVVCSDGLWNYVSAADELSRMIAATGTSNPLEIATELVAFANERGGHDNITVALLRNHPRAIPPAAPPDTEESADA